MLRFSPIVLGVTLLCCFLSIRFAVHRFNRETILLGDTQKFDPVKWCQTVFVNRHEYPTYAAAILFGLAILTFKYFAGFAFNAPTSFRDFAVSSVVMQVGILLLPAVILAKLLTHSPKKSLGLEIGSYIQTGRVFLNVFLAVLAAACFFPTVLLLGALIQTLYPVTDALVEQLTEMQRTGYDAPIWASLFLFAVLPGICEETAFRGLMLGGLLPRQKADYEGTIQAIAISALFFGVTHGILQQSINATILGCLLGYIFVRTGNLYPCIAYHLTHNTAYVLLTYGAEDSGNIEQAPFSPLITLAAFCVGVVMVLCLRSNTVSNQPS